MRAMLLLAMLVGACVSTNGVVCDDGRTCPEGSSCVAVENRTFCAYPDQKTACEGVDDGAACVRGDTPSACHAGVCLPIRCGNGLKDPGEMCDDGNTRTVVPSDGCSADCQSTEVCRNGVVDAVFGEQCDDGNGIGHDGCAASCVRESPTWTNLDDDIFAPRPESVFNVSLAFDTRRQRTVLFGGTRDYAGGVEVVFNTIHEWDGARWERPATPIAPQARENYQMAYDPARGNTVMFSGGDNASDTWLWDGATWTLAATTVKPAPRVLGSMASDSKRDRIIMFGGHKPFDSFARFAQTWEWTGTDWHDVAPLTQPDARSSAQMAYDPKRDRVVLYGGIKTVAQPTTTVLSDLWELDGSTWTQVQMSGAPGPRQGGMMAYDPVSQQMLLIGGGASSPVDVWAWDGTTWTQRPSLPSNLTPFAVTTDGIRGRIVMFAGDSNLFNNAIYELVGTTWVRAPASDTHDRGSAPLARYLSTVAFDTDRRRFLMFGGLSGGTVQSDAHLWESGWSDVASAPTARFGATATYDRRLHQIVMFGGCPTTSSYTNATYTFETGFVAKSPSFSPTARCRHAIGFDPKHGETVLFGGLTASGPVGDTYLWDGTTWTAVTPAHAPPALYGAAMEYDEDREKLVLFGGRGTGTMHSSTTWIWDGDARDWIEATPTTSPPRRHSAAIAWDPARHRLVLYGGLHEGVDGGAGTLDDVWEWDGTTWSLVPTLGAPHLDGHAMTPGLDGGVLVFGGEWVGFGVDEVVWRLRHDSTAHYETCTLLDTDGDGASGCGDGDCAARCTACGDGTCDPSLETCASCPDDCDACPTTCGDGLCQMNEICPGDC